MSPKIVQDLELTNTRVKYLIYVYPCGHRMVFSYLTLMTRAPCLRVSGTLRVMFPSLRVPPRSHYYRMEYDISAAAYSRLGGQMSSTRRRQGLLSRGRLSVTTKFYLRTGTSENIEPRVAESRRRKTTDRTTPSQAIRVQPPLPDVFFIPRSCPAPPVTQSMFLVSPPFLFFF